jgi:hypothetical protein
LQTHRSLADLQGVEGVEDPGSPALRGCLSRATVHMASPQDVLNATLVAVSAVLASREEYMHWLHEVCTEGVRLAWEVTLGLVVGLERPRARYACRGE